MIILKMDPSISLNLELLISLERPDGDDFRDFAVIWLQEFSYIIIYVHLAMYTPYYIGKWPIYLFPWPYFTPYFSVKQWIPMREREIWEYFSPLIPLFRLFCILKGVNFPLITLPCFDFKKCIISYQRGWWLGRCHWGVSISVNHMLTLAPKQPKYHKSLSSVCQK